MADFSIASQIQPVQLADPLQKYAQFNQLALHQAQLAEVQRAANEQNQLRSLLDSGIDRNSPEFLKQVYRISPTTGMTLEKGQAELQNAALTRQEKQGTIAAQEPALQKAKIEAATQALTHHRDLLPIVNDQATYDVWRANTVRDLPGYDSQIPKVYSPETKMQLMNTAAKIVDEANLRSRPSIQTFGENAYAVNPATATAQPITIGGASPATDAYGARTAQIEGTGKNPNSSAQGKYQFIDSTFVDTARKVFPELANKSPTEILALRGQKLANGAQIEDALEQRFRADNTAALTGAGIQPTAGNTYLAHFLGAGGATKLLTADPNTPVSQILDPKAIAANESILKDKTAGQVAAWANGKYSGAAAGPPSMTMGQQFQPPGSVPGGLNALTPMPAAPANALIAAQIASAPAAAPALPAPGTPISTTKPQPGFRFNAQGGQEPIPGSPESPEGIAAKVTATKTAEAATAQETAKANKKEAGQYMLRTLGGEGGQKIEDLINASTSGAVQKLGAEAKGMFGTATPGMQNIAQLDHIAKQMTYDLLNGKLGAGISNADRDFISGMVANIANPNMPANERIAGFRQLKNTMEAWASGKNVEIGAPVAGAAPANGTTKAKSNAVDTNNPLLK